jgi:hypothetical protein
MPRFAILEHDYPVLHWDLLLEVGDVLKAWRLAQPPGPNVDCIEAIELADHRLLYLDYEGPVSGGRGLVKRWDAGTYVEDSEPMADRRCFRFESERLSAVVRLTRQNEARWRWELVTAFS